MAATTNDAQLILQLYDLRREAVMRKARDFVAGFWPAQSEEVLQQFQNFGTQENAYLRQVCGYWEMAAALVNHGTLNAALFSDCNSEIVFIYAKFEPFLPALREMYPEFLKQVEQYIESSPTAKTRLERVRKRVAEMTKQAKENNKKEAAAD